MTQGQPSGGASMSVMSEQAAIAQSKLSVEERITLARKEGAQPMPDGDPLVFKRILEIIAMDAEVRVRQALAQTLAENADAPHEIVVRLAQDEDLVSSQLLTLSEVLTSDDLIAIIQASATNAKMEAIAARRTVADTVCLALIERCDDQTASLLLRNTGADIPEPGLLRVMDRFGASEQIQTDVIDRASLPVTVMERIVAFVSAELISRMIERHAVPATLAARIALETRERATLGLSAGISSDATMGLIEQIVAEGRLSESLLLRSLFMGNLEFIMHVIALRAHDSIDHVRSRFARADRAAIERLWSSAALPKSLLPALHATRAVLLDTQLESSKWDTSHYRSRIVERMMTQCDGTDVAFSEDDAAFLINQSTPRTPGQNDFDQSGFSTGA